MAASPGGTILTGTAGAITDSSGNIWSLVSTPNDGLRIAVNGTIDTTTYFVTKLEYLDGLIYQENINNDWWYIRPRLAGHGHRQTRYRPRFLHHRMAPH